MVQRLTYNTGIRYLVRCVAVGARTAHGRMNEKRPLRDRTPAGRRDA